MKKLLCSLCLIMLFTTIAPAVVNWVGPQGGDWNTAANWSPARVPVFDDRAVIDNTTGTDPSVVISGAAPDLEILDLANAGGSGNATLNINSGGSLKVTTTSSSYGIGKTAGKKGVLNINNGGSLTMANLNVGYAGYGELNISAGSMLTVGGDMRLGKQASHDGALVNMSGGTLNMNVVSGDNQSLFIGYSGDNSLTRFNMSGGTININNDLASYISVGQAAGSVSQFDLSGGTVNTSIFKVGYSGTATMNLSGSGILNAAVGLQMGGASTHGNCVLNMSGGQINSSNGYLALGWGADLAAKSELVLTGGSIDVKDLAVASNGKGRLTIQAAAASVSVDNLTVGGYTVGTTVNTGDGTLKYVVGAQGVTAVVASQSVTLVDSADVAALWVLLAAAPPLGNILLVDNQSSNLVSGVFDFVNDGSAVEGASVLLSYAGIDYNYTLTYVGIAGTDGIGNDIMLVIPEPATVALLAFGFMLFVRRRHN